MSEDTPSKMFDKKLPFIGLGLVAMIAVGLFVVLRPKEDASYKPNPGSNKPADVTIQLTEAGYVPDTVTIMKGQTVKFTTTRGVQFWPASDLHPTHGIYPEFDPRQPVEPTSSWSFSFEKAGSFKFHDHLSPNYRGTITVR